MGFSRAQQPAFRAMVAAAWKATGGAGAKPDRGWYEAELETATGYRSTADCNAGRDYDFAMARFEEIGGASIEWQMRAFQGDAKRIAHSLRKLCADHEGDEAYMRRIARQALRLDVLPELHTLDADQLLVVLRACKQQVTRGLVAAGERDPQVSRKTHHEKPPQVKAYWAAAVRKAAEAEVPAENIPF